jgi:hypothetical protein
MHQVPVPHPGRLAQQPGHDVRVGLLSLVRTERRGAVIRPGQSLCSVQVSQPVHVLQDAVQLGCLLLQLILGQVQPGQVCDAFGM